MGHQRCFRRYWTSKRRKAAAFAAGEWRRRCRRQELLDQPVYSLNDAERQLFVTHWPSSASWPRRRQPVATCLTEIDTLLEL